MPAKEQSFSEMNKTVCNKIGSFVPYHFPNSMVTFAAVFQLLLFKTNYFATYSLCYSLQMIKAKM